MIQQPSRDIPIAKPSGLAHDQFQGWIDSVTEALTMIDGAGSPEGVVYAAQKKYYFDTAGLNVWFKTTNEFLNTGWKVLS